MSTTNATKTNSEVITQEQFAQIIKLNYESHGNIYSVIDALADYKKIEYKRKPSKPFLKSTKPTEAEIGTYTAELSMYNDDLEKYNENEKLYRKENSNRTAAIEDFIKEESGLNTIPEQYRNKVYSYAYDDAHSNGYYEVYLKLEKLVDIFK